MLQPASDEHVGEAPVAWAIDLAGHDGKNGLKRGVKDPKREVGRPEWGRHPTFALKKPLTCLKARFIGILCINSMSNKL